MGGCRHGDAGALELVPAQADAGDGGDDRLDDDRVHELSVDELLERERPQRAKGLAVEAEGVGRQGELNQVEPAPVRQDQPGVIEDQPVQGEKVDERRGTTYSTAI